MFWAIEYHSRSTLNFSGPYVCTSHSADRTFKNTRVRNVTQTVALLDMFSLLLQPICQAENNNGSNCQNKHDDNGSSIIFWFYMRCLWASSEHPFNIYVLRLCDKNVTHRLLNICLEISSNQTLFIVKCQVLIVPDLLQQNIRILLNPKYRRVNGIIIFIF